MRNLYAVLVHESRECVIDLVRNLHYLDPTSNILLYNGSEDPAFLQRAFPWERHNAVVHPSPRPMKWGWLHDYALDCMRFGVEHLPFDTLTIVDSDQLALRPGYSEYLERWLAGRSGVGMLGSVASGRGPKALAPPAAHAVKEVELWRPFLRRFERGEAKFVHWTFWPTTVFTADAARALLQLWPDQELQTILTQTKIWASEEVILPTLVALLGYSVDLNPCHHAYVRYRVRYTRAQLDVAMADERVYWAHPIPRKYDDPLRAHVRTRYAEYARTEIVSVKEPTALEPGRREGLVLTLPILQEIRAIEGWLSDEEADLLIATTARALSPEGSHAVVEVGSYCGKATIAIGRVVQAVAPGSRICSVDRHDGVVGSRDGALAHTGPTRSKLGKNLERAGLAGVVEVRESATEGVSWSQAIRLLMIDGLHDYAAVAADFNHFSPWLEDDAFVVFHDYADYFPGVKLFVDELLGSGHFTRVRAAGSLVVLRRRGSVAATATVETGKDRARASERASAPRAPAVRVTCIMPTANRRRFVPHAIRHFLGQSFAERELVIVDDGADAVHDLVPEDPRIRYIRLDVRASVGEKRNVACQAAAGEIIVHWDDDDWAAPGRLTYQVEELERTGAALVGLDAIYYHELSSGRSFQYRYPKSRRPWVSENSLCYRKTLWERRPFERIDVGEDSRFVWGDRSSLLRVHTEASFLVAMIHGANVSPKRVAQPCWHPVPGEAIRTIMGADFDAYRALAGAAGHSV